MQMERGGVEKMRRMMRGGGGGMVRMEGKLCKICTTGQCDVTGRSCEARYVDEGDDGAHTFIRRLCLVGVREPQEKRTTL